MVGLEVERVVLVDGFLGGHLGDLLVGLRVVAGEAFEGRRAAAELAPGTDGVDGLVELLEVLVVVAVELSVLAVVGGRDLVVGADLVVLRQGLHVFGGGLGGVHEDGRTGHRVELGHQIVLSRLRHLHLHGGEVLVGHCGHLLDVGDVVGRVFGVPDGLAEDDGLGVDEVAALAVFDGLNVDLVLVVVVYVILGGGDFLEAVREGLAHSLSLQLDVGQRLWLAVVVVAGLVDVDEERGRCYVIGTLNYLLQLLLAEVLAFPRRLDLSLWLRHWLFDLVFDH